MPSFSMFLPILPTAQKRHRSAVIAGHVRTYTDAKQRTQQDNLREMLYKHLPLEWLFPLQTPIFLSIRVLMPIPKGTSKVKIKRMLDGEIRHDKKPDVSNLLKHFEDVANGVLYRDDKLIWAVEVLKEYSTQPGWEVMVEW